MSQLLPIIRRLGFVLFLTLQLNAYAQNYQFTALSGTFTPLTGATAITETYTMSSPIDIGFNFVFNNVTYTQLRACEYGFISLAQYPSCAENDLQFIDNSYRPIIAPLWDYMYITSGGSRSYLVSGTAPNRVFTFQWLNSFWQSSGMVVPIISFQVKLYETSNQIDFVYRNETNPVSGTSASIGMAFADPISYQNNGGFLSLTNTSSSPGISKIIETKTINTKPATGQIYRFNLVNIDNPTSFVATTNASNINLNWTDASGANAPDGYLIMASSTNTFTDPIDYVEQVVDNDLSDGAGVVKVLQSQQNYSGWVNANSASTWYFKIYSYKSSGSNILYKVGSTVPSAFVSFTKLFFENNTSNLPSRLNSYAVGDYNGDGFVDILGSGYDNTSYPYGPICKVYKNNGNGTFSVQSSIELKNLYNGALSWADYDNDNDLDILITGVDASDTPYSKIYSNNGDNTFTEQTGISLIGVSRSSVSWADYDNDGDLDLLLTGNKASSPNINVIPTTKLYRNDGSNTFTERTNIILPSVEKGSVAWGDYDNDGDQDILITGDVSKDFFNDTPISKIYRNDGNDVFTEQTGIVLENVLNGLSSWADYDNDGNLDILLSGFNSQNTGVSKIYRNNGNNTFLEQTSIVLVGVGGGACDWIDYDNDGKLDIILSGSTNYYSNLGVDVFNIYHNNGDSTFTLIAEKPANTSQSTTYLDVNNDNRLDAIVYDWSFGAKLFINGTGTVNVKPATPTNLSSFTTDSSIVFKWNRVLDDATPSKGMSYNIRIGKSAGASDVVTAAADISGRRFLSHLGNTQADTFYILRNPKNATYYWNVQAVDNGFAGSQFAAEKSIAYSVKLQATSLIVSSVDGFNLNLRWTRGNGSGCVVFGKKANSGTVQLVDNSNYIANPQFGLGTELGSTGWFCLYNGNADNVKVEGLELNSDYIFQVVEYESGPTFFTTLKPTSVLKIRTPETAKVADFNGFYESSQAFGDFDNDGDLDFIISGTLSDNNNTPALKIYKNQGKCNFVELTNHGITPVVKGALAWGDYDNDGYLDLVVSGSSISKIYHNNGNDTFTELTNSPIVGLSRSSVVWSDLDNDGDLDLLICGSSSTGVLTKIYKNNKFENFSETPVELPGISDGSLACGDYDNDGLVDIIISGNNLTQLFHNNGNLSFTKLDNHGLPALQSSKVLWGDEDNDGYLDLFISGNSENLFGVSNIDVYHNNHNGTFTKTNQVFEKATTTKSAPTSAVWTDLNGDGFIDLAYTGGDGYNTKYTKFYLNNGDKTYTLQSSFGIPDLGSSYLSAADFDNNGYMDILISGLEYYVIVPNVSSVRNVYSRLYSINSVTPRVKPSKPAGLIAATTNTDVKFTWNRSKLNQITNKGINYSISIGTSKLGIQIKSGNASNTGYRLVSELGNCFLDTTYTIKNLTPGKYYWSVQPIDNSFIGGEVAIDSFIVASVQASNLQASILPDKSGVKLKWKNGNGTQRVVFCKKGSFGYASPSDNSSYFGDPEFEAGDQIESTRWYCVFNGRADSAIVYGFLPGDEYMFEVMEYVGTTGHQKYYQDYSGTNIGNFSAGLFSTQTGMNLPYDREPKWADMNADGLLDIVYSNGINYNQGNNTFLTKTSSQLDILDGKIKAFADFNNDGYLDVLTYINNYNSSTTLGKIWINNHNDTFTVNDTLSVPETTYNSTFLVGDIDNDGDIDFVYTYSEGMNINLAYVKVFKNDGSGKLTETSTIPTGNSFSVSALGDFNTDGFLDIFISGSQDNNIGRSLMLTNDGTGVFTIKSQYNFGFCARDFGSIDCGDYDNDGDLDIIYSGGDMFNVIHAVILKNSGDGVFEEKQDQILNIKGGYGTSVAWGDYDNDGYLDIISTGYGSGLSFAKVYHNNGNNSFSEFTETSFTGVTQGSLNWGDYDNDGDLDFLLTGVLNMISGQDNTQILKVYRNNTIMKASNYLVNAKPAAPQNLKVEPQIKGVKLSWSPLITDETPEKAMSYSLRYKKVNSAVWLKATNTSELGYRRLVGRGNIDLNKFLVLDLPAGNYIWQVQAIDGAYRGSEWSVTNTFEVKTVQSFFSATTVCLGSVTTFMNLSTVPDLIETIKWYFGDNTTSTQLTPTHLYAEGKTYIVSLAVKDKKGVRDSFSMPVIVKPILKPEIISDNYNAGKCMGDNPITLKNLSVQSGYSYKWYRNSNLFDTSADSISGFLPQGDYTLEANFNGCTSVSKLYNVYSENAPKKPTILYQGPKVWYLACSNDSVPHYNWYFNGTQISNAHNFYYVAKKQVGTYMVEIANDNGCYIQSDPLTIPIPNGNQSGISLESLNILPNPSNGLFTVEIDNSNTGELLIQVFNGNGLEVLREKSDKRTNRIKQDIDITGHGKGVFIIRFTIGDYREERKVIVY